MIIAVDGMGGDFAPELVVEGCIQAVKEYEGIHIIITGKKELIKNELDKREYNGNKIEILNSEEVISTNEAPVKAIRRKKDSSMVKALELVKEGKAQAVISAGSTGALMAGATFVLGRIKGINRVCLAPLLPGAKAPFMIADAGANVDCKAEYLVQFAMMGKVYFESVLGVKSPTVGLVNIGAEEEKGNELTKAAYKLLKDTDFNFIGNIEPRDIPRGEVNIAVCDGFIGNTVLKTYEGVASNLFSMLKKEIMASTRGKIGGALLKPVFKDFKKKFDYTEYGGSPFLGAKGICIKAHGSSDAKAFKNAIRQAKICYDKKIIEEIENNLGNLIENNI
ncbi:phosphate acyltransferase PlsX [Clostridium botulinum]|uniref:Phosphate acyltransferase n=1 Tax=Clostridium botulinum (strain Langeland / NCTC 10281 / Type F) TaxID=441772 RepID=PLSX_CLOBL|nr:phosphate acyltransferase PlsX [Clostridium botulinum]A7GG45.1 RecName: Full=Phosphate acyltransferase; AltName: Full=Acyl-ACP phosphotransacylase; AltName: Full=Acyl-[acyl-carrier-protein]--phosphate acyltransferase; AltName: Full=Phosphate-acyl-ACP acyltransferase [Clostridium botulinum F str. Langeland]ABS40369.1 fatty acid/phospholipid synthesis protein PlsX [Clostridium botulinum F str. Langeland]ADG00157.1 fatty acid/phospholipid synthesis protein PlsX [Clostridium botulinum F str. 2306